MKFPDSVTIKRPSGADEYGNPGGSWATPTTTTAKGFLVSPTLLLLPASAVISKGDRVTVRGKPYEADPVLVSSPSRSVLWTVTLAPILEG